MDHSTPDKTQPENGLRAYMAVTAAYWAFMLCDGALRMLVLLHFNMLGFSPIQLAWLFLLYEVAGIVTNLSAGWIAARFGLASTLFAGLALQIGALVALAQLDPSWSVSASVIFVMAVQGAAGVAKDLTKMSSKSAVKLLAPQEDGTLFKWVAILTGSKNAVKGLGFFMGAAMLGLVGFETALMAKAALLGTILIALLLFMPKGLPTGKKGTKFSAVWSKDPRVNKLSLARVFLFGARDVWFVVGLPIYFKTILSDGTAAGNREAFFLVGGFMALWIIAYGLVQGLAPKLLKTAGNDRATAREAARWAGFLTPIPFVLAVAAALAGAPMLWLSLLLVVGLLLFGFIFAVNSSVHSYLILAYAGAERVTMDVGFYYMANAAGRLLGTLLSGVSYQLGGLPLCLATAGTMAALSWISVRRLAA